MLIDFLHRMTDFSGRYCIANKSHEGVRTAIVYYFMSLVSCLIILLMSRSVLTELNRATSELHTKKMEKRWILHM